MNRAAFQRLSHLRVREARALLRARCYAGAYYLLGYAVECALKACIAKQVKRHDFPPKDGSKFYTHKPVELLRLAGLKESLESDIPHSPLLADSWATVKDWSEEVRYDASVSKAMAHDMLVACTRPDGILGWLRERW
ncbi:MAG: DNA-binding protein [Armatimonadetes bacterium]|nr:DNA-binding protein [Armatimonadota bacterium]